MKKLFEMPELLTLDGSPFTESTLMGRIAGGACGSGCESGCNGGCDSGAGLNYKAK